MADAPKGMGPRFQLIRHRPGGGWTVTLDECGALHITGGIHRDAHGPVEIRDPADAAALLQDIGKVMELAGHG